MAPDPAPKLAPEPAPQPEPGVAEPVVFTTSVGIVGGGPAGLLLSHLLHRAGVDNIVIETRDHETIRTTHRAGILEAGSVRVLAETGVQSRVLTEGHRHDGIQLRFNGISHRLDFADLVGESVWLYPQNEVFVDLAAARERDGGDVRYGVTDTAVSDLETRSPKVNFTDAGGTPHEIRCDYVAGTDGSRSICRQAIPDHIRTDHFIEYPFAWFGILTEAPPSSDVLIYNNSPRGFALISQRSDTVQRMYFQCDPQEDPDSWSEEQIWSELQARLDGPDGFQLTRGPIFDKTVLPFRSYVCEPMNHGTLFLAGDAGHTVPPTGAKGLNLALADVQVLAAALESFYTTGSATLLDAYSDTVLERVWKAQNFSYWMTSMLHTRPEATSFEHKRALGELAGVAGSRYGQQYLAEAYTGWPATTGTDTPQAAPTHHENHRNHQGVRTMTSDPITAAATNAPAANSDSAKASQDDITAEIAAIHNGYRDGVAAGQPVEHQPRIDFAPYRSSILRHPTKSLHHADPETIELWSPAFGHRDVHGLESDLTIQHNGEPIGERMKIRGRVLDGQGRPVRGQLVEIWQANAAGRYIHQRDQHPAPIDPNFTGTGRCLTGEDGSYEFTTIKPGPYPWKNHRNAWRPAHIHFSLFGTDFTQRLVTQMYFPGDPLFGLDPIYQSIADQAARDRLIANYDHSVTTHEWATGYNWDIVLSGSNRTGIEDEED